MLLAILLSFFLSFFNICIDFFMLFMYNLIIILTGFLMFYLGAIIIFMSEKTQNLREFLYFSKLFLMIL
ncbi:hypothetical protein CLOSTMETH_00942 [[Clostridium] methylpentosum DSM 5476]|uniref:Uncharacterized protein n=1 Tax=[Clostridium] methylpentosum DSM 5476 TaxID=537013 RepID=C0EAS8_9FIRM|nr:hypothetical protein CLOSTMETH_00942 [[Clostridium] methylpentosum DSM 5476]